MDDGVLNAFHFWQRFLTSSSVVLFLEMLVFLLVIVNVGTMALHFLFSGRSLRVPLAMAFFYALKLLSDTSLVLERPRNTIWLDFKVVFYRIEYESWFLANVDPYLGLLIISILVPIALRFGGH